MGIAQKEGYLEVLTGDEEVPPRVNSKVAEFKEKMKKVIIDYEEAKLALD